MIIHVDMDAFFASVEQRDQPWLRGKPVVVGGSKAGRGVVAAASYEARAFGIHSAMSGARAAQLCPHAIFVKCDGQKYSRVGKEVREILQRFTPIVQPLSCDEAFLDVSGTLSHFPSVEALCRQIKSSVADELQLVASVGAAPLKFVAKIASDFGKPDGCVVVTADQQQSFLDPLPIGRLWGVGEVSARRLQRFGIATVGQMRLLDPKAVDRLGSWAQHLYRLANGIDPRSVETDRNAKQISHERTFSVDLSEAEAIMSVINFLADQVCRRARHTGRRGRTISIKYRTGDFRTYSRSRSLPQPTNQLDDIWPVACELFEDLRRSHPVSIRLIGFSLAHLSAADAPRQLSLLDQPETQRHTKLDAVTDVIAAARGHYAIYRGTAHRWASQKRPTAAPPPVEPT